jgi:hypothetical protein
MAFDYRKPPPKDPEEKNNNRDMQFCANDTGGWFLKV